MLAGLRIVESTRASPREVEGEWGIAGLRRARRHRDRAGGAGPGRRRRQGRVRRRRRRAQHRGPPAGRRRAEDGAGRRPDPALDRGALRVGRAAELTLKGKAEPVIAYPALGPAARRARRVAPGGRGADDRPGGRARKRQSRPSPTSSRGTGFDPDRLRGCRDRQVAAGRRGCARASRPRERAWRGALARGALRLLRRGPSVLAVPHAPAPLARALGDLGRRGHERRAALGGRARSRGAGGRARTASGAPARHSRAAGRGGHRAEDTRRGIQKAARALLRRPCRRGPARDRPRRPPLGRRVDPGPHWCRCSSSSRTSRCCCC